jgi:uncharacterized membrane protein (UPF0127 family)
MRGSLAEYSPFDYWVARRSEDKVRHGGPEAIGAKSLSPTDATASHGKSRQVSQMAPVAYNHTRHTVLCEALEPVVGKLPRLRGLIGRDPIPPNGGVLLQASPRFPVTWLHTFGNKFPIDIVFLSETGTIVDIDRRLRPWRTSSIVFGAHYAIELPAGRVDGSASRVGDRVVFMPKRELPVAGGQFDMPENETTLPGRH